MKLLRRQASAPRTRLIVADASIMPSPLWAYPIPSANPRPRARVPAGDEHISAPHACVAGSAGKAEEAGHPIPPKAGLLGLGVARPGGSAYRATDQSFPSTGARASHGQCVLLPFGDHGPIQFGAGDRVLAGRAMERGMEREVRGVTGSRSGRTGTRVDVVVWRSRKRVGCRS